MRLEAMAVRIPPRGTGGTQTGWPSKGYRPWWMRPETRRRPERAGIEADVDARGGGEGAPLAAGDGMVDYRPGWDGHDARRKIGLLTEANLVGSRLAVSGYLYARDFPEVAQAIQAQAPHAIGRCSHEARRRRASEICGPEVWRQQTRVTFAGRSRSCFGRARRLQVAPSFPHGCSSTRSQRAGRLEGARRLRDLAWSHGGAPLAGRAGRLSRHGKREEQQGNGRRASHC